MGVDANVQAFLDRLSNRGQAAIEAELERQANRLADAMRAAAPDGPTGNLDQSVRVEPGAHPLERIVAAGGELTTRDGYDYALAVEFGTEKMPAEPFFWPTYRHMREEITAAIERVVAREMK